MKIKTVAGAVSALAILALCAGVQAQTANSESNSSSGAASQSGSASFARGGSATGNTSRQTQGVNTNLNSGVTVDQRSYGAPSGSSYSNYTGYGGGTNNYNTERSTGDVTVRTTPQVYAPPVSGGNPCTLAVSGGISVIGWGAAAGGTFVDQDCANRQKIAMIHNSGRADLAFALMCNDKDTYMASKRTAAPCAPNPAFEPAGTPMAQVQPGPTVVTPAPAYQPAPVRTTEYPRCRPPTIVDNCRS